MEVLDDKANGAPHMEPEEIVSVRDRKLVLSMCIRTASFTPCPSCERGGICGQAYARPWPRRKGIQGIFLETDELEEAGEENYQSRVRMWRSPMVSLVGFEGACR